MQCAACLHGQLSDLGILIIQEIQNWLLNKVDQAHSVFAEIKNWECFQRKNHHGGPLIRKVLLSLITFDLRVGALFYHLLQEFLVVFVENDGVEVSELETWLLSLTSMLSKRLSRLVSMMLPPKLLTLLSSSSSSLPRPPFLDERSLLPLYWRTGP